MLKRLLACAMLLGLWGCVEPQSRSNPPARRAAVDPIRNTELTVYINMDFCGQTVQEIDTGKDITEQERLRCFSLIEKRLAELGSADGNSIKRVFRPNAAGVNFCLYYNAQYDKTQARWKGTHKLEGWGRGDIAILNAEGHKSPEEVIRDLVDQGYRYIHLGWH